MYIFFFRKHNDLDHLTPVIYKTSSIANEKILALCQNPSFDFQDDYRVNFLTKKKNITFDYVYNIHQPTIFHKISSYFTILIVHRRFDLIERTLQLLPDELSADFSEFKMQLNKAKSANNSVRFLVSSLNRVIAFFGSDYRIHLIY